MGRELRRVPPNWKHPKTVKWTLRGREEVYVPLINRSYREAVEEWIAGRALWTQGKHPDQKDRAYEDWAGDAPQRSAYLPEWPEGSATWYQVYETVSDGTPVTPPFAKRMELVEYLVKHGDFWDQQRRKEGCTEMTCNPWVREEAVAFVFSDGWAPLGRGGQMNPCTRGHAPVRV